jgi:nucleotide-binding universal stress UspA family protein
VQLATIITENAKEFDLIIMGTDGESDITQFFSGSHTYNVIKKAAVPVLLIPVDCSFADISNTVYAFDYFREEKLPITQLAHWLNLLKSKVCVLEVLEKSVSLRENRELKEMQNLIEETLPVPISLSFHTTHSANVAESINEYVLDCKSDMLALCSQHHSLLGRFFHTSVIRKISIMARYPVFVFHH